jgi:hypothetical protein
VPAVLVNPHFERQGQPGKDNRPADYVAKNTAIVDLMHQFWSPEVSPDSAVLELG